MQDVSTQSWPEMVFGAPLLRGLDQRGRHEVQSYGRLHELTPGQVVFRSGEPSDCIFVVLSGEVQLRGLVRGDEAESVLRTLNGACTFGEEALVPALKRTSDAQCTVAAVVAEVPMNVLARALARAGELSGLEREMRQLRREVTRDLLRAQAFSRHLSRADLELLLDAVHYESYESGQFIYRQGEHAPHCLLLQKGLIQLQSEREGRVKVHGYLSTGDFFGDEELLSGHAHRYSTVALGDTVCIHVSAQAMLRVCDRNPGLAKQLRRLMVRRHEQQAATASGSVTTTQHVLKDVYRMQIARSLLAIDQNQCVRCGHCAWACAEVHEGVTRLIRSGDKVLVPSQGQVELANLLLPNTCQHCEHPACMIDCPTGAIGRDPEGEVFVREELCTGCGACAKACPWQNIQLAPRAIARVRLSMPVDPALVAVKCDLCRDYAGPACVKACPTDALQRLDPSVEFDAVRALVGRRGASPRTRALAGTRLPLAGVASAFSGVVLLVMLLVMPQAHALGRGFMLGSGVLAAVGVVLLATYALVKRGVRWWMRPRIRQGSRRSSRSKTHGSLLSPWLRFHRGVGLVTLGFVGWHAGVVPGWGLKGALLGTFMLSAFTGVFGALSYRWIPVRLTRLEWRGSLPEELAAERAELADRLYRLLSGKDAMLKKVAEVVLLPYSRSTLASLRLLCSGRDLAAERARLSSDIEERLKGRGHDQLSGLDELIKTVVDLRALPLRRGLTAAMRSWQPLHAGLTITLLVLLLLHLIAEVG